MSHRFLTNLKLAFLILQMKKLIIDAKKGLDKITVNEKYGQDLRPLVYKTRIAEHKMVLSWLNALFISCLFLAAKCAEPKVQHASAL